MLVDVAAAPAAGIDVEQEVDADDVAVVDAGETCGEWAGGLVVDELECGHDGTSTPVPWQSISGRSPPVISSHACAAVPPYALVPT